MVHEGGCSIPPAEGLSVICHNSKADPVPSLWSSKESVKVLCLVQPSHHRGGAAGPRGWQHLSRVTLCVAQSESGPGTQSSDWLSVHSPTLLVTSVAAASSRLGFCPVHPHSAQTCPVPLGGQSLLLSQFPHPLEGGGVPETPGPSQLPSSRGAWTC